MTLEQDISPDEPQESPAAARRGGARERQRRRRERHTDQPEVRRTLEHLGSAVPKRVTLPKIHFPQGRTAIYVAAGAIVFMAVVGLLGRLAGDDGSTLPPNAIWIGTE